MMRRMVSVRGGELAVLEPAAESQGGPLLVWAHGWGQSHQPLLPIAEAVRRSARSVLLDLPGFGIAPPPPDAWRTADYADAVAEWLAPLAARPRIWVAYSFGCRVGLQLAARHPALLDGMFLVAAPGLPRQRSPIQQARFLARRWAFRLARQLTPEGPARDRLRERFGSTDYRMATPLLRQILVKAVNENLGAAASAVRCPCMLVYGERDDDASPDIGERFQKMIPGSRLVVLRGFGHLDIVTDGRHQIAQLLTDFVGQVA
jgi:pimeloyl-ACP methyl ester carboxylesterase